MTITGYTAPERPKESIDQNTPTVFLAGTIDLGKSWNWQEKFIRDISGHHAVVFNPRRETWEGTPSEDNPDFTIQVGWELEMMERADIIAMYLAGDSASPVSLLEMGMWLRSGKLIVGCEPTFHRHGNVALTCARFGVPVVNGYTELLAAVKTKLPTKQLFERPCPACTTFMVWHADGSGYYCRNCQTWVAVPRARGTVNGNKWTRVEE